MLGEKSGMSDRYSNRDTETFTCVEDAEVITLSSARAAP